MTRQKRPLVAALEEYISKDRLRLHMPGHKGARQAMELLGRWGELALWDVTEADGLDDLHAPRGAIAEAGALLAAAVGAAEAHFLVNGASVGMIAALLAACARRDGAPEEDVRVILPRNAHRSAWSAVALAGCTPVWLAVGTDKLGLPLGIVPRQLEAALARELNAAAAFFVYPSFYGVCVELPPLLAICRRFGAASVVDEAHGASLSFIRPELAAIRLGADLVIDSWHKSMGSLGQTAVLLAGRGGRSLRPERWLTMLQTSSPSYPLLASLDEARAEWCEQAGERAAALAEARERISGALRGAELLRLYRRKDLPAGFGYDESKALLYSAAGHSGWQLAAALRGAGVEPELADWRFALLLLSYADKGGGLERLAKALRTADAALQEEKPRPCLISREGPPPLPEQVMTPRQAMRRPVAYLPLPKARGRIAAGLLTPYPPGIPLLGPGERIGAGQIAELEAVLQGGGRVQGVCGEERLIAVVS